MPKDSAVTQPQEPARPKGRPGRKRLRDEVFVPVTVKVEPSELATIESIAKNSDRSRSDVMREMLSYGLAHVMQSAFGGGMPSEEDPDDKRGTSKRVVVGTYLPPYEIDVIEAMSQITRQSRSKVLRTAVERALGGAEGGTGDE